MTTLVSLVLCLLATSAAAFNVGAGLAPSLASQATRAVCALPAAPPAGLVARTQLQRATAPTMGLFGLGTPELAIIAGVALLVLGPDQVKKMAKEVGKVSAELKQVPEEFNKGMEVGAKELEARKAGDGAAPPSPPPAA